MSNNLCASPAHLRGLSKFGTTTAMKHGLRRAAKRITELQKANQALCNNYSKLSEKVNQLTMNERSNS